ncbi:hypothetical protein SSX86_009509 [Deinandra increscens subsp. villosa]|uniref:Neprosin PEP catalytic domain-containing protein n=1 Tax=Deinandra increscens subsp. villosa TaxID=3103831 RepID=A0AAP0DAM1_9ASTR
MKFKLIVVFLLISTSIVTSKNSNISRHVIKTIRVKDGDIIDCVDIYKQPAFDHPVLKNHTIQMKSSHLDPTKETPRKMQNSNSTKVPSQPWLQHGSCPNGTIPFRRSSHNSDQANVHPRKVIVTPGHSFSVALTEGYSYSGAKGNIKVWNPYVESIGDYSSSQVMLRNGPWRSFETVHAGWAVNPIVYNDAKTRLFVDGMKNTGCFDLTCPGFVQTSSEILLGGDIGYLYGSEISIQISKDPSTNNWWFRYNDKEVGYWPGEIFQLLKYQATLVQWGGEVYSPKVGTHPHTKTAMGNGQFSDFIFRNSGMISGMLIEANSHPPMHPETLYVSSDEWDCYDAYILDRHVPEPVFFYGGPGGRRNPRC